VFRRVPRRQSTYALSVALFVAIVAGILPSPAAGARFDAKVDRGYTDFFTRCGPGWNGGDSGYSFALKGPLEGKVAWLWSDSLLGYVRDDGTLDGRRELTSIGIPPFIRNSITVQPKSPAPPLGESETDFVTLYGAELGTEAHTMPSFPGRSATFPAWSPRCYEPQADFQPLVHPIADGSGDYYWAGDGVVEADGTLKIIFRRVHFRGPKIADIVWHANDVVVFTPVASGTLRLDGIFRAPTSRTEEIRWGAATLTVGRWVYVYGTYTDVKRVLNRLYVARVPVGKLQDASTWRFWTGKRFSRYQSRAKVIGSGVDHEFSVVQGRRGTFLISADGPGGFIRTPTIRRWKAASPLGPFRGRENVYRIPRANTLGGQLAYNVHVHPALSSSDGWLVSYSVLGPDFVNQVFDYRPHFVRVRGLTR
jgi:hypothetical protein